MSPTLRNVAALIAAAAILQAALGIIGVHLPIAFAADGYSRTSLGLVAALYSAGFMAGAWFATTLLSRVGHIRVFAASAALFAVTILMLHFAGNLLAWCLMRIVAGFTVAMVFAAAESWLASSIRATERGEVMGFYMVATKAAIALGPFLVFDYAADAPEPWMICAAVAALAVAPICFTTAAQPEPPKAQRIRLRQLFATAPAAVIASFGAGLVNSAVLVLAPLYAAAQHGPGAASGFYAAIWTGSLLLQWPAGRISDQMDRRVVIASLSGLAALASLPLALFGSLLPEWTAAGLFFLWGAGGLSFYGIAVAHMADRAEPGRIAQSASGLLFVWAAGAIAGPLLLGVVVDLAGWPGLFGFAALGGASISAAMFWRRRSREAAEPEVKESFSPYPATSVAAVDIALGDQPDAPRPEP